ncbi:TadE family type IV pilus minor pilin [Microbacterium sp. NPDC057944]|uniref:TadE family type IV pilus minor pilin n=1 Tax=Microbacterium sp. NPDC057944 TaxID=3346286 RepID=UPI0036DF0FD7
MSRRLGAGCDRGSVAAELALALPAVVLTILLGAGALSAAARQVSLQDAAADAARILGRGEGAGAAAGAVTAAVPGAGVASRDDGGLVCVTASVDVAIGGVLTLPMRASSCALSGGL